MGHALLALALCCSLACSGPKSATKKNFARAIDRKLAALNPVCIENRHTFPASVEADDGYGNRFLKPLQALKAAGLLESTETDVRVLTANPFGPRRTRPGFEFKLTAPGRAAWNESRRTFCFGTASVDQILRFTEPATALGVLMSQVQYTLQMPDRAPWSQVPEVIEQFPALQRFEKRRTEGETAIAVLTSDRWEIQQVSRGIF